MMTIITRARLRAGSTEQWDRAMHTRVEAARGGVWESKEAWAAWHNDDAFTRTREQLSDVEERPQESVWFEVVENLD